MNKHKHRQIQVIMMMTMVVRVVMMFLTIMAGVRFLQDGRPIVLGDSCNWMRESCCGFLQSVGPRSWIEPMSTRTQVRSPTRYTITALHVWLLTLIVMSDCFECCVTFIIAMTLHKQRRKTAYWTRIVRINHQKTTRWFWHVQRLGTVRLALQVPEWIPPACK